MEPQKLRQSQSADLAPPGIAATVIADKMGPYDPTCPVSVAMAKLRSLIGESPEVNSADLPPHAQPVPRSSTAAGSSVVGAGHTKTGEGVDAGSDAEPASLAQSLSGRRAQLQALAQADRAASAAEEGEHEVGEAEDEEEEEVPLECLRYFKLLNRRARR